MKFDVFRKAPALNERGLMALCIVGPNTHIMVSGGHGEDYNTLMASVDLYNLQSDSWRPMSSLNTPRCGHSMIQM